MSARAWLRPATAADLDALRALFADAVRAAGPEAYTPEQVAVWARAADDAERFRTDLVGEHAVVAEDAGGVLGFANLDGDRVSALYTRGDAQRRGLGGRLLRAIVAEAERRGVRTLRAEANVFSLGLFERHAFRTVGRERVVRGGVAFERPLVTRELG